MREKTANRKSYNTRNPLVSYWMVNEIYAHACARAFPDWGSLAVRYMENKRRDHAAAYAKRRPDELKYKKEYRQRIEVKKAHTERGRQKKIANPGFRIRCNMAKRLGWFLNEVGKTKNSSVLDMIGCSQDQLRDHLEKQFFKWMTWENYGKRWQVDHILPCASFDHTDPNQVRQCWHFTNLRPLCSKKNASKSDTITHPQMSLLLPAA